MNTDLYTKGGFTLPGEAGYEDLTLELAQKWGADVIRDSDGTQLSDKIITSGYDIYSTICLVRADNDWAKENMDKLQQCYLMSFPVTAEGNKTTITLLKGYFKEQFLINSKDEPKNWWQVFDRTTGQEVSPADWKFCEEDGTVSVRNTIRWHRYTVNFLVYRIWEEISAYNHVTNNWGDREHLMPIEPMYPETQVKMLEYLEDWLKGHPHTKVVRFTSMFYNFFWLWSGNNKQRFIVNDWGSYEFTVNPYSIKEFEKVKGYRLTSEDFVNAGLYNSSYLPPSQKYRDWMDFINEFVVSFGKKCIELVHKYEKKAYVFYNDHWIGIEPTLERFKDFNFDGIIDGVFSGFETRKVAGTKHVAVRELRLHPYFFPTGVNGAGTFVEGGNPTLECKTYWQDIRRALLRDCVDRIGFGGYLHLVKDHPEFVSYIEDLAKEFRQLRELHCNDKPYSSDFKVAILSAWGNTRAWGCRGHFNRGNYYNEVMESVSGMPVEIVFISFEDILREGIDKDIKVIINAGGLDDSWSGGWNWKNPRVIEIISEWIYSGGGFIAVGEATAQKHADQYFQLSNIMGVDRDTGLKVAFDKYPFEKPTQTHFIMKDAQNGINLGKSIDNVYALNENTLVLANDKNSVQVAVKTFGKGRTVYFSGHRYSPENIRLLHRAIFWSADCEQDFLRWTCKNIYTECAYYPKSKKLVVINISTESQETVVFDENGNTINVALEPYGYKIVNL